MQIYLARNQQQAGPYTLDELNLMLKDGQVVLTDLMWHQGMQTWKSVGEMTQQQYHYQPVGVSIPNTNSSVNLQKEVSQSQPQTFAEQLAQRKNQQQQTKEGDLASVAQRFFAKLIDICLWLPAFFCLTAFMSREQHIQVAELQSKMHTMTNEQMQQALFEIIPTAGWIVMLIYIFGMLFLQGILLAKTGQSVGKKVMQIQIVDAKTRQPVNMFRAFTLRSILFIFLNGLFFPLPSLIDYLFALGKNRQALHDKISKTIVVNKK